MDSAIPAVEITDNTDTHRIGCPDRKQHTMYPINNIGMCAEQMIYLIMDTRIKFFSILFGNDRLISIRIIKGIGCSVFHTDRKAVFI